MSFNWRKMKARRGELCWSVAEVVEMAEMSESGYRKIEAGLVELPHAKTLRRLARVFRVEPAQMLGREKWL